MQRRSCPARIRTNHAFCPDSDSDGHVPSMRVLSPKPFWHKCNKKIALSHSTKTGSWQAENVRSGVSRALLYPQGPREELLQGRGLQRKTSKQHVCILSQCSKAGIAQRARPAGTNGSPRYRRFVNNHLCMCMCYKYISNS
jgi:hypothetical protein